MAITGKSISDSCNETFEPMTCGTEIILRLEQTTSGLVDLTNVLEDRLQNICSENIKGELTKECIPSPKEREMPVFFSDIREQIFRLEQTKNRLQKLLSRCEL